VRLVLLEGGPLRNVYEELVSTEVLGGPVRSVARTASSGLRSLGVLTAAGDPFLGLRRRRIRAGHVVLANTFASLASAAALAGGHGARARLVCHVHELDGVADRLLPSDGSARSSLLGRVDTFIATGEVVRDMLVGRMGVEASRVTEIDGWVDQPATVSTSVGRRALGVDADRPLVLGVGAMHRRKGPERFVDLMTLLADHPARPEGRWMGGVPGSPVWTEVAGDVLRSPAAPQLDLVPSVEEPLDCLAVADVVVSTSIEDPFPLSVLEAAALGVPVVGYDSGGLGRILEAAGQSAGAVPVGDLLGLARVVRELLDDGHERRRRGRALQDWVLAGHTAAHLAPHWWRAVTG